MGDEAHVGLVDAHAERDGGDHDDAVVAQEARLVRGPGARVEPGMVRQRLRSRWPPGIPRSSPPTRVTGSRRCRRPRRARCAAGRAVAAWARSWPRCGTGCSGGRSSPRSGGLPPGSAWTRSPHGSPRWPSRSARYGAPRASARAVWTGRDSRAGSRAPTGPRSAPRRWRKARSCRGRAVSASRWPAGVPAPGRAGQVHPRGRPTRPGGARRRPGWN